MAWLLILKSTLMARITITCKTCGNVFDWNDQWPDGLKRCPLCGILVSPDFESSANGVDQPIQSREADLKALGSQAGCV